jgi:hypothetical protein
MLMVWLMSALVAAETIWTVRPPTVPSAMKRNGPVMPTTSTLYLPSAPIAAVLVAPVLSFTVTVPTTGAPAATVPVMGWAAAAGASGSSWVQAVRAAAAKVMINQCRVSGLERDARCSRLWVFMRWPPVPWMSGIACLSRSMPPRATGGGVESQGAQLHRAAIVRGGVASVIIQTD